MKPTGSPSKVVKNKEYERVVEQDGSTYPNSILLVVRHKKSGKLYACNFIIYDDTSDYDVDQHWREVRAKIVEVVTYVNV